VVLTHRYAEAWTIPHRTSSRSRFANEADTRRSGSTALTTAIERAGLTDEGFTIHSLRNTFATTLADKGVHPSTAQKMLGHSDIRMTLAIYTHATDGMQDAATAALEEAFSWRAVDALLTERPTSTAGTFAFSQFAGI
jgi:integrase